MSGPYRSMRTETTRRGGAIRRFLGLHDVLVRHERWPNWRMNNQWTFFFLSKKGCEWVNEHFDLLLTPPVKSFVNNESLVETNPFGLEHSRNAVSVVVETSLPPSEWSVCRKMEADGLLVEYQEMTT